MKFITSTSGIHKQKTRSALSLTCLLFLSSFFMSVKAFPCFTTKYQQSHQHHFTSKRGGGGVSPGRFEYQDMSSVMNSKNANHHRNTNGNGNVNAKETRLFSVPKYIAQEIRDLFLHTKVKQQDYDDGKDKERSTMNVILQELADHYDASDAQGKHELLQRVDDQIEELAERMAVLKSLSEHLQMGDDYLLEDQEVSAMKRFLSTTASSLKCGKHVEYLDGKEINGLRSEIISAIQKDNNNNNNNNNKGKSDQSMELFNLQEDYYLETKMKQEKEESLYNDGHSYDAWLGF